MTYNQSVLNKYRSELLQEQQIKQENTSHYKHKYNLLQASPQQLQQQKRMQHKLLHVQQQQKANNDKRKRQNHNVCDENTVNCSQPQEAKEQSEKQWTNNQMNDRLLMIKRFKSKTCPYCNRQRSAAVKHINPHTKPPTPQAFYNDILINKYRHVQSPHAQRNLALQIDVGCKTNKQQNHNGAVSLQSTHLHSYPRKQINQQNFHQQEECSEQQKVPNQFNSESKAFASQQNNATKEVQKLQHQAYMNNNNDSESVSVKCSNRESTNAFSKSKLFVLGPMVDQSELPFRMLCREYGATVAFTPMLHAKNFVQSAQYRQRFYSTTSKRQVLQGLHLHKQYHHYWQQQEECRTQQYDLHQYSGNQSCELQQQWQQKQQKYKQYQMQMNDVTNDSMQVKHGKLIDRPLVVQICGNDADTILAAARLALYSDDYKLQQNDKRRNRLTNNAVKDEMSTTECNTNVSIVKLNENQQSQYQSSVGNTTDRSDSMSDACPLYSCDAVDINLGCPQGIAKRGHYGSFLMEDWQRIHTIIHTLHVQLEVPVTAKIRVFDKPRSATHNCNNNSDSKKNTNSDCTNNSALSTKGTKCSKKDDSKINNEIDFAYCGTSDLYCEKCAGCEQTLLEPITVSYQHHHQHQQSSSNENITSNTQGKGESKHWLHCQNGQYKQMFTLQTHDKFSKVIQQQDCYVVRCTKQDCNPVQNSNCSCSSSDDSLQYDVALTIAYAMMIRDAGAQMLTIHGRTRAMKGQNTKLANLALIRDIHAALNESIPVIANGNVLTFDDVMYNMSYTQCEGVMCAQPLLWDPSLFTHPAHPILCGRSFAADKLTRLRAIQLALRYLTWCTRYPIDLGMIKAHLYKLCYHSYEIHHTLRNALAHVCDDGNLLSSSSIQQQTVSVKTKDEKTTTMCYKSSQDNCHKNGCKDNRVGIDYSSTYMKQLCALCRHLHQLYMIEKASSVTGPQPKLLRLVKEASRTEVHANNFFDDANVDEIMSYAQSNEAETNVSNKNNKDNRSNTVETICDESNSNLGIVF